MEYKYELHCHTGEVSRCGQVPAKEIVRMYKERGYNGLVITDHYSPLTFLPDKHFFPQRHIDFYLEGYRQALEEAGSDFTVLLGMELRFYATINDYLVYGVTEDFLRSSGNLMTYYPRRFSKLAHENGMLFLQAHPFREMMTRADPKILDGTEIFNAKEKTSEESRRARAWALKNKMKIRISGTDFHRKNQIESTSGIITGDKIETNADLLKILRSGSFKTIINDT